MIKYLNDLPEAFLICSLNNLFAKIGYMGFLKEIFMYFLTHLSGKLLFFID